MRTSVREAGAFPYPAVCVRCRRQYSAEEVRREIAWTPLRSGWRCPNCSRAHAQRINALADALVRDHSRHGWAGTAEHTAYDECVFCEVVLTATQRLLQVPPTSPER
jgi:hypothetical protein